MDSCVVSPYSKEDRGIMYNYLREEFSKDAASTIMYQVDTSEVVYLVTLDGIIKGWYCYSTKARNRVFVNSCYIIPSARRNRQVITELYQHGSKELYKFSRVLYTSISNDMIISKKYCDGRYIDIKKMYRKVYGKD